MSRDILDLLPISTVYLCADLGRRAKEMARALFMPRIFNTYKSLLGFNLLESVD